MKKALIIFTLFFVLPVIQSCGIDFYDIVDIEFNAIGQLNEEGKTVIPGLLQFEIHHELEYQRTASHYVPKLVQECYAITVPEAIANRLILDSFSLSFDKPFLFRGELIPSGTNVFEIPDIRTEISVYGVEARSGNIFTYFNRMDFSAYFMDETVFDGEYDVDFSCETSDGRLFHKSAMIVFIQN